jgi:hypothetical protein
MYGRVYHIPTVKAVFGIGIRGPPSGQFLRDVGTYQSTRRQICI